MTSLALILGDQLFDGLPGISSDVPILMVEDFGLCTRVRHHRQKLVLFLSAMRHFAERLRASGFQVEYHRLAPGSEVTILDHVRRHAPERLVTYEPADRFFADDLRALRLSVDFLPNPMFLTAPDDWDRYRRAHPHLKMADFYRIQRRRLGYLMEPSGEPTGGRWSFDEENRKPLPARIEVPEPWYAEPDAITREVIDLVDATFPDHPGKATDFRYPVTHEDARAWLADFVETRFARFGDYEDALSTRHRVVFHGLLSPFLNTGLLTPQEVLDATMSRSEIPLNAREGFLRQVIGWREFVRGVHRETPIDAPNHLGHSRHLSDVWYTGDTGLLPLDVVIRRARDHAWCHHIERLMVAGSAMLLCEVHPQAAYDWFMDMFLDSADWVMGPNVYGMSQFADPGTFATKPYISGSAYLRKMGDFPAGPWCDVWDGLYWRFIDRHRELFARNPRTSVIPRSLDKLDPRRRGHIFAAAEAFVERTTTL